MKHIITLVFLLLFKVSHGQTEDFNEFLSGYEFKHQKQVLFFGELHNEKPNIEIGDRICEYLISKDKANVLIFEESHDVFTYMFNLKKYKRDFIKDHFIPYYDKFTLDSSVNIYGVEMIKDYRKAMNIAQIYIGELNKNSLSTFSKDHKKLLDSLEFLLNKAMRRTTHKSVSEIANLMRTNKSRVFQVDKDLFMLLNSISNTYFVFKTLNTQEPKRKRKALIYEKKREEVLAKNILSIVDAYDTLHAAALFGSCHVNKSDKNSCNNFHSFLTLLNNQYKLNTTVKFTSLLISYFNSDPDCNCSPKDSDGLSWDDLYSGFGHCNPSLKKEIQESEEKNGKESYKVHWLQNNLCFDYVLRVDNS